MTAWLGKGLAILIRSEILEVKVGAGLEVGAGIKTGVTVGVGAGVGTGVGWRMNTCWTDLLDKTAAKSNPTRTIASTIR